MKRSSSGRLTKCALLLMAIGACAAAWSAAAEEAIDQTASTPPALTLSPTLRAVAPRARQAPEAPQALEASEASEASEAPEAPATAPIDEYRLGPGDRVRVVVFGHEDLSGEFEVDGAGRISLPLIQMVIAAGSTTVELEKAINDSLQPQYLKNPRVSVEMIGYRPVYILGEVRQPGSYPFTNGMTVVNAVALAGGYTYRAAKKKITVTRGGDPGKSKQLIDEDTPIFPGDVVEIPERFF